MSKYPLLNVAVGLAVIPASLYAQGSSSSAVLEEIVVTAERREASLQSVPVPVTAITAEALANKQVTEARDLARYAPSLKMFNNITTPTNLSPSLRGSLQQDASLVVAESPFGIYVDDVYIARLNGNNITLSDIERVEVLRGPQGTLYGRNTLAGAIKFVSRSPGESAWRNISFGAGNYNQQRVSLSVGDKLSDNWAGSLSVLYTNKDDQFFNRNPTKAEKTGLERSYAARGKLRYMGVEGLDVAASFSYADSDNDGGQLIPASTPGVASNKQFTSNDLVPQFGNYVLNTPNVARINLANYPYGKTKQTIASLNVAYDMGGSTLRSITGYVRTEDSFTNDFSGNGNVMASNNARAEQYSEEIQVSGKAFGDKLSYLVGLYLFSEEGTQAFAWNSYLPPPLPTATPISTSLIKAKTESYSAFAQFDYLMTDALKVTAGIRYTNDTKDFDFLFRGLLPPITPAVGIVDLNNIYSEVSPRFSIDYTVPTSSGDIDSMLVYASAASGFKSGGFNGIAIFGFNDAKKGYAPESNWTYEAGIKTDLLGDRLRVNANYFLAKADDLALNATVTNTDGTTAFPVQNSGKATIQGLEFEITAVPADGMTIFLSGTAMMDGKYDSLNPTSAPANALANFGVRAVVPQTPSYSLTAGFDYGFDNRFGRTTVGADWFQTDDYITAATNDFKVKGYGQGNAFVNHAFDDNWSLRGSVKNLTDEYVITTGSRGFLGGFIPLRPREYMVSVTYKLD
jgi:iron complex outermembrane receptor protein